MVYLVNTFYLNIQNTMNEVFKEYKVQRILAIIEMIRRKVAVYSNLANK